MENIYDEATTKKKQKTKSKQNKIHILYFVGTGWRLCERNKLETIKKIVDLHKNGMPWSV